jgi:hypothetical protein
VAARGARPGRYAKMLAGMAPRDTENILWEDLRQAMGAMWDACRHEDEVTEGVPDVSWAIGRTLQGWIELKVLRQVPATEVFRIPLLRPAQRVWMRRRWERGALCQVWVRIAGKQVLVFTPESFPDLGKMNFDLFLTRPSVQLLPYVGRYSVARALNPGHPASSFPEPDPPLTRTAGRLV